MRRFGFEILASAVLATGLIATSAGIVDAQNTTFRITSTAFENNDPIPMRNSAYGENVSPALSWTGAPADAQSFALVLDDPDAGAVPFVHWVIYNIPRTATGLPEGIVAGAAAVADPAGATQGITGLRRPGYFGPRPPAGGVHNYNFRLYALRTPPNLPEGLTKADLLTQIQPNIIAETVLVGTYQVKP
jgi:Raf kinase inhibitor-like YbhB/YbcL family protein